MKIKYVQPPAYNFLFEKSDFKIIRSGRDSAKSVSGHGAALVRNLSTPYDSKIASLRESKESLRESSYDSCKFVVNQYNLPYLIKYNHFVSRTNSARVIFEGLKEHAAHSIKSLFNARIVIIDEANYVSMRAWDFLIYTVRAEGAEIWAFWNPEDEDDPAELLFNPEINPNPFPNVMFRNLSYLDNIFLSDTTKRKIEHMQKHEPKKFDWIYGGGFMPELVDSIFTKDMFIEDEVKFNDHKWRMNVVSVDPAGSSEEDSNETGVIVHGISEDDDYYVHEDCSGGHSPDEWCKIAWEKAALYNAKAIVVEKNQGGDLLKSNLRNVKELKGIKYECPIILIHSKGAKHERARIMQPYYENGRVFHNGRLSGLTKQLRKTTMRKYEGKGSPDRMDAQTVGFNYLNKFFKHRLKVKDVKYDAGFRPMRNRR